MTGVAVSGAAGRMGKIVAAAVEAAADLELTVRYDPGHADATTSGDPESVAGSDVVVEFTRPDVVMENLSTWQRLGVHAVVGTSGFTSDRIGEVETVWGEGPPNCLIVPNFSIGAVLMMRFAELAAPHLESAEIIEAHHADKVDAPSGTAIATAGRIAAASAPPGAGESIEMPGARGASVDGIAVHSVRLPGAVAHQEVVFSNPGELLTIRHDTTDWSVFVPGVLLAVRRVSTIPGVSVGLEQLLGI